MTVQTALPTEQITVPGVYDIPSDQYHADPVKGGSLSSSGIKNLIPPKTPAHYRYEQDHRDPTASTKPFDVGNAAHKLVLGVGPELVLVDRDRWDTKDVKARVVDIRAAGNVPLKRDDYDQVHAMAAAIRAHPIASALFAPGTGTPEASLFWVDRHDVWCRARLDWLPDRTGGRMVVPDYKTCTTACPLELPKAIDGYGYHRQADLYLRGVRALGLAANPAWLFVFQEKTPPYLITVVEPTAVAMRIAQIQNDVALFTYAECVASGQWPGHSDDIELIGLPPWREAEYKEEFRR